MKRVAVAAIVEVRERRRYTPLSAGRIVSLRMMDHSIQSPRHPEKLPPSI